MFRIPDISYLKYVVEAAVQVDRAIGGMIQLHDASTRTLRLHTRHGFSDAFAEAVDSISIDEQTTCAQAARDRRHVVIRDVLADASFEPYLLYARLGRFRSVQSTPLIDTQGRLVGVLTTQFSAEHHPGRTSLLALQGCARVGARLIEVSRLHGELKAADERLGIPRRSLSPAAGQAADAARMLLPIIAKNGDRAMMETAERHFDNLIHALSSQLRPYSDAVAE